MSEYQYYEFLALDRPLTTAEQTGVLEARQDPRALAAHIAGIPASENDRLLGLVAADQAMRPRAELLRGFRQNAAAQRPAARERA